MKYGKGDIRGIQGMKKVVFGEFSS